MYRVTATTLAGALFLAVLQAPIAAHGQSRARSVLRPGEVLHAGDALSSPDGAYTATLSRAGRLVLRHGTHAIWSSTHTGPRARLVLRRGNLVLLSGRRVVWSSRTAAATALVLGDNGVLALRSPGGTVWSNRVRNGCHAVNPGKRVVIDLGDQFARLCNGGRQVLTTPITSGATALGDGTPTGTWRVQSKQRDRYLYPASGGAYYVHYWIPYDGVYGMHDSSWQHFPYGSARYRTAGSHGCVHFPLAAIRWMYGWLRVGTLVRIGA
jgi:hypothetical protein